MNSVNEAMRFLMYIRERAEGNGTTDSRDFDDVVCAISHLNVVLAQDDGTFETPETMAVYRARIMALEEQVRNHENRLCEHERRLGRISPLA